MNIDAATATTHVRATPQRSKRSSLIPANKISVITINAAASIAVTGDPHLAITTAHDVTATVIRIVCCQRDSSASVTIARNERTKPPATPMRSETVDDWLMPNARPIRPLAMTAIDPAFAIQYRPFLARLIIADASDQSADIAPMAANMHATAMMAESPGGFFAQNGRRNSTYRVDFSHPMSFV